MQFKHGLLSLWIVGLLGCGQASSKVAGTRVIVDRDSIKLVVADTFPKSLSSQISVGPPQSPSFVTEGDDGRIDTAAIDLGLVGPRISLLRKQTKKTSYLLFLFLVEERDHGAVSFFDLDLNGEWDVKKTPNRERTQFIRLGTEWHAVDKIDGITSEKTTAVKGKTEFVFDNHKWTPSHITERAAGR